MHVVSRAILLGEEVERVKYRWEVIEGFLD